MAYLPTSSLKMGDWTDEDHQECLRLMHKAHGRGILKALVELVEQENDWSVISGRTTEGNMSDAAKRQRSEDEIKELKNVSPQKFVPCSSQPAYAPMPAVAAPTTLVHPGNELVPAVQLPPGVTSIEKWGRTMVSFWKVHEQAHIHVFASLSGSGRPSLQGLAFCPLCQWIPSPS